jgi:hypothetical protein
VARRDNPPHRDWKRQHTTNGHHFLRSPSIRWNQEAKEKNIVITRLAVEPEDGKFYAVARLNNQPLHRWVEPLD